MFSQRKTDKPRLKIACKAYRTAPIHICGEEMHCEAMMPSLIQKTLELGPHS